MSDNSEHIGWKFLQSCGSETSWNAIVGFSQRAANGCDGVRVSTNDYRFPYSILEAVARKKARHSDRYNVLTGFIKRIAERFVLRDIVVLGNEVFDFIIASTLSQTEDCKSYGLSSVDTLGWS